MLTEAHTLARKGDDDTRLKHIIEQDHTLLHQTDDHGRTPLHIAVGAGHLATIALLVELGADIEATSLDRRTPLHWAVVSHRPSAVEALAKLGADPHAREEPLDMIVPGDVEKRGKTPLDLASDKHGKDPVYRHIAAYLRRYEAARGQGLSAPDMDEEPWKVHARTAGTDTAPTTADDESRGAAGVEFDDIDDIDTAPRIEEI